jgi:3-hydroxyisobutyrate dehydrogenase-like beta-hydroxyacid dehydrogenase
MEQPPIRIGFVGVGRMGANMARRLNDYGYRIVAVQDCHTARAESLARELGCEAAVSPARVAELSDTVMTVVSEQTVHQLCDHYPGNPRGGGVGGGTAWRRQP